MTETTPTADLSADHPDSAELAGGGRRKASTVPEPPARRRTRRALTIVIAVLAAGADWFLCTQVVGIDLMVLQGTRVQPVLLPLVLLAPIAAGLTGWGLLALLERRYGLRGRDAWRVVAIIIMLTSNWSPVTAAQSVTVGAWLVSMHLVVGLILIIGLAPLRRRAPRS